LLPGAAGNGARHAVVLNVAHLGIDRAPAKGATESGDISQELSGVVIFTVA